MDKQLTADGDSHARGPLGQLLKKLGLAAFLFFLIKGLAWLIVPAILAYGAFGGD